MPLSETGLGKPPEIHYLIYKRDLAKWQRRVITHKTFTPVTDKKPNNIGPERDKIIIMASDVNGLFGFSPAIHRLVVSDFDSFINYIAVNYILNN